MDLAVFWLKKTTLQLKSSAMWVLNSKHVNWALGSKLGKKSFLPSRDGEPFPSQRTALFLSINSIKMTFIFFVCMCLWKREITFKVVGCVSAPCGVTCIQGDNAGNPSDLPRFLHMQSGQYISGFRDLLPFVKLTCISCISACHLRCFFPRNLCSRSSDCFRSTWTRKTRQSIKNQFFLLWYH